MRHDSVTYKVSESIQISRSPYHTKWNEKKISDLLNRTNDREKGDERDKCEFQHGLKTLNTKKETLSLLFHDQILIFLPLKKYVLL